MEGGQDSGPWRGVTEPEDRDVLFVVVHAQYVTNLKHKTRR